MKPSDSVDIIRQYFPELNSSQLEKIESLKGLYLDWNAKINVISRKDTNNFYTHHVLHSLAIAKVIGFNNEAKILDVGTGGGFPGIPLAIYFQNTSFTLIDSIGKKIKVVKEISNALDLNNVKAYHKRAEEQKDKYDFIISRAVTHLSKFCPWISKNIKNQNNHSIKNGIIYLKGGDIKEELKSVSKQFNAKIHPIKKFYEEDFFDTKLVLHLASK